MFLIFGGDSELRVEGYINSDFMSDPDDRNFTSGYVFVCNDGAVSWKSFKQPIIADSTTEAEYVAASDAAKEGFYFKKFVVKLRVTTSDHCRRWLRIKINSNYIERMSRDHFHRDLG